MLRAMTESSRQKNQEEVFNAYDVPANPGFLIGKIDVKLKI